MVESSLVLLLQARCLHANSGVREVSQAGRLRSDTDFVIEPPHQGAEASACRLFLGKRDAYNPG